MQSASAVDYTIEIDLNEYLCNADNIQEITFEFIDPSTIPCSNEINQTNERIIDIDINELRKENADIKEISAEINGEDTIIKTINGQNSKDEIDILQMDEKSQTENSPALTNSFEDQVSLETQIEF